MEMKDFYNETFEGIEADRKLKEETKQNLKYAAKNEENRKAQAKMVKPKSKGKLAVAITSIAMAFVMGIGVGAYFILRGPYNATLQFNAALGEVARERTENAQYLPNVDKLTTELSEQNISPLASFSSSTQVTAKAIDLEGFLNIKDALATIEGEGAGKYLGYDIYEIKNEIAFVLKTIPAFNQWFRLPTMRTEQGFVSIPYYEGWAYYLECDEEAKDITITRVCWRTRFQYWDFERGIVVEDYERDGTPIDAHDKNHPANNFGHSLDSIIQYQVMQTKYYFDEQDREVVECYVYAVAVDNYVSGTEYNSNLSDYKPISIEYLKNVKDTSLTKYRIRMSEFYDSGRVSQPDGNSIGGMDIRGLNPNGSTYDFVQIDYVDSNDISLLRVTGELPVDSVSLKPQTTGIAFYRKTNDLVQLYTSTHDYLDIANSTGEWKDYQYWGYFAGYDATNIDIKSVFTGSGGFNRWGGIDYAGSVSSNNVTRAIKYYDLGTGSEINLMQAVCYGIVNMADGLGVSEFDNDKFQAGMDKYGDNVDYTDGSSEKLTDDYIAKIREAAVKGFTLKNDWAKIYENSSKAIEVAELKGEFYGQELPISYLDSFLDMYNDSNTINLGCARAGVLSNAIKSNIDDYSLSVALVSETGNVIVIWANYGGWYETYYKDGKPTGDFYLTTEGWVEIDNLKNVDISEEGTYTLQYVVTKKEGNNDVVVFDTKLPLMIIRYAPITMTNGYKVICEAKVLKIIV